MAILPIVKLKECNMYNVGDKFKVAVKNAETAYVNIGDVGVITAIYAGAEDVYRTRMDVSGITYSFHEYSMEPFDAPANATDVPKTGTEALEQVKEAAARAETAKLKSLLTTIQTALDKRALWVKVATAQTALYTELQTAIISDFDAGTLDAYKVDEYKTKIANIKPTSFN